MRSKNVSELPRGGAVALYAFTFRGLRLATRLADILDCAVYVPFSLCREDPPAGSRAAIRGFSSLAGLMRERFHSCRCHIFVAAAGIAVRAIAPFLRDKAQDPAVVVLDQRGRHVVSLLSGHLGGGNAMAEYLAAELGAEPVITTASDLEELPAVDVLAIERGLILSDTGPAKKVAAALLAGKSVPLSDPGNFLGIRGGPWESLFPPFPSCAASPAGGSAPSPPPPLAERPSSRPDPSSPSPSGSAPLPGGSEPSPHGAACLPDEPDTPTLGYTALPFEFLFAPAFAGSGKNAPRELEAVVPPGPSVAVTVHCPAALSRVRRDCLVLHPPLHAGIGCRKGAAAGDIRSALSHVLALHALAPAALAVLASVEAKKEESGLIECARSLGLPLLFFSPARLARFPVSFPSPKAREIFGIEGVCEPAALAAARDREGRGHLLVRKTVFQGVTVALALSLRETLTYSLEGHSPGSFRS